MQVALCKLALYGHGQFVVPDLTAEERDELPGWTREEARAECARVIAGAEAQGA